MKHESISLATKGIIFMAMCRLKQIFRDGFGYMSIVVKESLLWLKKDEVCSREYNLERERRETVVRVGPEMD